ncbi:hypothetical protein CI610_03103 [invertebrate metagenome]|uniref:Uncharacterized protein n=1 Tax=invertebrate metagenome TaxID=1711999 RepID=A0A2H9T432_9ZZZZ
MIPGYKTDHSAITLQIIIADFKRGRGFWKFNNSLLKDTLYINKVKETILKTKQEYALPVYNISNIPEIDPSMFQSSLNDQLF